MRAIEQPRGALIGVESAQMTRQYSSRGEQSGRAAAPPPPPRPAAAAGSAREAAMRLRAFILVALAFTATLPARVCAAEVRRFDTPEAAVEALTSAAKQRDFKTLRRIFGPLAHDLVTPDIVQKHEAFRMLIHRLTEKTELSKNSDSQIELRLGADAWPFPIPLVKKDGHWYFDYEAGKQEILHRRIGADELGAIAVCRAVR